MSVAGDAQFWKAELRPDGRAKIACRVEAVKRLGRDACLVNACVGQANGTKGVLLASVWIVVLSTVALYAEAFVWPIEVGLALRARSAAAVAVAKVDGGVEEGLGDTEAAALDVLAEPDVYLGFEGGCGVVTSKLDCGGKSLDTMLSRHVAGELANRIQIAYGWSLNEGVTAWRE